MATEEYPQQNVNMPMDKDVVARYARGSSNPGVMISIGSAKQQRERTSRTARARGARCGPASGSMIA